MKIIFLMLICSYAYSQGYEYAHIYQSQSGSSKSKAAFYFNEKSDSAKHYGHFKTFTDALNYADGKGWEFIGSVSNFIDTQNPAIGETIVILIRRRKKGK